LSQYLNVPFAEKDQAKTLGARWDGKAKQWYVPDGVSAQPFAQWVQQTHTLQSSLIAPLYLRTSCQPCWRCSKVSRVYCLGASAINDVQYDDDDGQPYSNIVETENDLIDVCDLEDIDTRLLALLNQHASTYRPAFSKTKNSKCWMNHCEHCDAKIGDFFLHSEPGGAFFPMSEDESTITDSIMFEDGNFLFNGGFSF
jgi:Domain of unknown function (DUF5710)